ncbi:MULTISPECIES: hypothetical protein [unclassified Vibrio]|uniref:hypothetical protein n=1 Tax=unclassified Vibrio TaxID=2614977 RepID=UPI000A54482C|nr:MULTISPECIES: hypothetical protein [unclassified Vibrio]
MNSKLTTALALYLLHSGLSYANEINLPSSHVIDDTTLSTMRGGFKLANDYIVDIGISISAAVNGKNIYRTTIANLVFRNGTLTAGSTKQAQETAVNSSLVNIVQVGKGNVIANTQAPYEQSQASATVTSSSIINIIQNTLDNSVLGLDTVVDIDAQVKGVNKQIQDDLRLKSSMLNHHY